MTKLGAKLLTATIKNPTKREIIYRMLMDYTTAYRAMEQNDLAEKMLKYVHNYLDKPNLVIINLLGGLGNQMYLYIFGKALEFKGYSVIFDGGQYKNISQDSHTGGGNPKNKSKTPTNIRNLEITNFNLTLPIDLDFDKELFFDLVDKDRANLPQSERLNHPYRHLINSAYDINSQAPISPRSYFSGYHFLSPIFAKHLDSAIRADFSLKTPLSPANANLKARILDTKDSAFLHIRRGDYLEIDTTINLCDGAYYEGAIRLIKSKLTKPHIFIFSNDIAWCKQHFLSMLSDSCKEGVEFEFVANNGEDSAVQEMELMRSCKNAINANSTFSWWASYLIDNPRKIVVMPNRYHKDSALITYNNDTVVFESVVLCDAKTGEIL